MLLLFVLLVLTDHVIVIQERKRQAYFTALHSTKEKTKQKNRNVNIGITPQAELCMLRCMGNSTAVFLHLLMFLSVRPQILIHITMNIFPYNTARIESFRMSNLAIYQFRTHLEKKSLIEMYRKYAERL